MIPHARLFIPWVTCMSWVCQCVPAMSCAVLSHGAQVRLSLSLLFKEPPHILLLDEPTVCINCQNWKLVLQDAMISMIFLLIA